MNTDKILFKKLEEQAILPSRGSSHAAGLDLYACKETLVPARGYVPVSTGVAVAIPEGFYGRIAPRSGLAAKHGIDTLAGVIDSDYRGELICLLANHSEKDFEIKVGDRVAQFVIESIIFPVPEFVSELPDTDRGDGGFGSTGY